MDEADRRAFLIRYAALALGALASSGAAALPTLDKKKPPKALYGPPPRPPSTVTPTEPKPPVALYGPLPRPNPLDTATPDDPATRG